MNKKQLLALLAVGGLAAIISCDNGSAGTAAGGLDANDCPIGSFRPTGIADCVFPSTDVNNQPVGVSDNRCAVGQPAIPPQCVGDNGQRDYLSTSMNCAPGYRFLPGACNRNGFTTGAAGATFFPGDTGAAGVIGTAGTTAAGGAMGAAGAFTGEAGSPGTGGFAGAGGMGGSADTGGSGGTSAADAATGGSAGSV
jgi:hypothetical protein